MSANSASGNIEGFIYVACNAFHQTAVNFIGQNVGAQQYDRVKKIFWISLGSVFTLRLSMSLMVYAFGPQLLSIYITDSEEAIAYGLMRLGVVGLPYFLCGLMDVSTGALRGLGASVPPMIISILGVCGLRIGWIMTIFQIPMFHTPQSLYLSYPISWALTFLIQTVVFFKLYKKQTETMEQYRLRSN